MIEQVAYNVTANLTSEVYASQISNMMITTMPLIIGVVIIGAMLSTVLSFTRSSRYSALGLDGASSEMLEKIIKEDKNTEEVKKVIEKKEQEETKIDFDYKKAMQKEDKL